jgi:nucleotide-binding universal stress UspA family protein
MIKNILLGTDFSPKSNIALKYAIELKKQYEGTLTVLSVNEAFLSKDEMVMSRVSVEEVMKNNEKLALNAKKIFKEMLSDLGVDSLSNIQMVQREGAASEEIIKYSEEKKVDFIVIGSNGHSTIEELFLGSTAKKIINGSKIPILVVPLSN